MVTSSDAENKQAGEEPLPVDESSVDNGSSSTTSTGGGLIGLITCRRRAATSGPAGEPAPPAAYRSLVVRGRKLAQTDATLENMAWWSDAETHGGGRTFVIAPRGPADELDAWLDIQPILAYSVSKMHEYVVHENRKFSLVWVQLNDHRASLWGIYRFYSSLHPRFKSNLDELHVIHPSWGVRILRLALWPLANDSLWDHFHSHERIEFLDSHLNLKKLGLPQDIYDYDKWLDKHAEETTREAARQMSGHGFAMPDFASADAPGHSSAGPGPVGSATAQREELERQMAAMGLRPPSPRS